MTNPGSFEVLGTTPLPEGGVRFSVWAPRARSMAVEIVGQAVNILAKNDDDIFSAVVSSAKPGDDYSFILDGEKKRPDPMSRCQPHGVHGPSRIVHPAFAWTDAAWQGIPPEDHVFSEIHIGTYTPEGTFDAMIGRLPHVRDTGITAIEIMPVSAFPGKRNWGYDGVHLFAPFLGYGGVDGLKRLVDAAHGRGLAVFMDVVYNHLGPEGNYLSEFGPYFTNRYRTPWGDAINYDGDDSAGVRRHIVANAVSWIEEYHIDGLRLDAVHEIYDQGERHILREIAESCHAAAAKAGRIAHIIAESPLNDARVILPVSVGGCGLDAQWNDDFHHALRTFMTGRSPGYMADFGRLAHVARAVTSGYVRPGDDLRTHMKGAPDATECPGERMVVFIQNHDQIANASGGRRIAEELGLEAAKAAAALVLLSPALPLLFMGEEYGEIAPFEFFTDFGDVDLIRLVRKGRKREIESYGFDAGNADPFDIRLFNRCRLDWSRLKLPPHQGVLRCYRDLLALRRTSPALRNGRKDLTQVIGSDEDRWIMMERRDKNAAPFRVLCNFSGNDVSMTVPGDGMWRTVLWTGARLYGGGLAKEPPGGIRSGENLTIHARSSLVLESDR
ncbi:MAG: malto-oligosyltrehalose trehalohydrolase [Candidatus Hydrogenedentota bacterium]